MPVLVDEEGRRIAGDLRVCAGKRLGLDSIPVIVARGWTEEEKRAYRLADNQLAARASWDPDLLRNELCNLKFSGFDLELIGFEPDRLEEILAGLGTSGLTNPDSVPKVQEQPITVPGEELGQRGRISRAGTADQVVSFVRVTHASGSPPQ